MTRLSRNLEVADTRDRDQRRLDYVIGQGASQRGRGRIVQFPTNQRDQVVSTTAKSEFSAHRFSRTQARRGGRETGQQTFIKRATTHDVRVWTTGKTARKAWLSHVQPVQRICRDRSW
jgi:hypothetical protein